MLERCRPLTTFRDPTRSQRRNFWSQVFHVIGVMPARISLPAFGSVLLTSCLLLSTFHIPAASRSFLGLSCRQARARCRLYTLNNIFGFYTFPEPQLFLQLCHVILSCSLPCIAWPLSGVACSRSAVLSSHRTCRARFYVPSPR